MADAAIAPTPTPTPTPAPAVNTFGIPISLAGGSPVPVSTGTPTPTLPPTINSGNIQPQAPIPYNTPAPTPTYPVASLDTTLPTPVATPTEDSAQSLTQMLETLNNQMTGKTTAQTTAETNAGIPDINNTITDLTAQLTGLQNEASAIPISLQNSAAGRGITANGLAPIQEGQLRDNAVQALTVSTLLAAAKGNLADAQSKADAAVAQQYGPIQAQIDAATANLKLIQDSPDYSNEEKAQAAQQTDIQNQKQAALDAAKTSAQNILTIAMNAAQNGADAQTLQKITQATTPEAALAIAGASGAGKADTSVQSVNGRKVLINNQTGATIKDLGADVGTPTAADQKSNAISTIQSGLNTTTQVPGSPGVYVMDSNGNITPQGWTYMLSQAPSVGLTRADMIKNFGSYLVNNGGTISSKFGLTPVEIRSVTGSLTGTSQ